MNIFLDASVLYKDPFWKGNFYKELLEATKKKEINLYVSSIVLKELERNYLKIINEENEKLSKIFSKASHYEFNSNISYLDEKKSVESLKDFYKDLQDGNFLKVLEYKNDYLPEIVERAIHRLKPFNENKTELKDAITWLVYAKFVEKEKLDNCIFLTDNVTDFCDLEKLKKKIIVIHNELLKDTERFKVYVSPRELIQGEREILQSLDSRFAKWVSQQNFDSKFFEKIIKNTFSNEIQREIENRFDERYLNKIFSNEYIGLGYLEFESFEFTDVYNIYVDIFENDCLLSGDVLVHCSVNGYEYMSVRDPGEDKYSFIGNEDIEVIVGFSFLYDQEKIINQFEVNSVELNEW